MRLILLPATGLRAHGTEYSVKDAWKAALLGE